jgi:hypothetical protein
MASKEQEDEQAATNNVDEQDDACEVADKDTEEEEAVTRDVEVEQNARDGDGMLDKEVEELDESQVPCEEQERLVLQQHEQEDQEQEQSEDEDEQGTVQREEDESDTKEKMDSTEDEKRKRDVPGGLPKRRKAESQRPRKLNKQDSAPDDDSRMSKKKSRVGDVAASGEETEKSPRHRPAELSSYTPHAKTPDPGDVARPLRRSGRLRGTEEKTKDNVTCNNPGSPNIQRHDAGADSAVNRSKRTESPATEAANRANALPTPAPAQQCTDKPHTTMNPANIVSQVVQTEKQEQRKKARSGTEHAPLQKQLQQQLAAAIVEQDFAQCQTLKARLIKPDADVCRDAAAQNLTASSSTNFENTHRSLLQQKL